MIEVPLCEGTNKERVEHFVKEFVKDNFQNYKEAKINVEEIEIEG
jgi:hypothetical protein